MPGRRFTTVTLENNWNNYSILWESSTNEKNRVTEFVFTWFEFCNRNPYDSIEKFCELAGNYFGARFEERKFIQCYCYGLPIYVMTLFIIIQIV